MFVLASLRWMPTPDDEVCRRREKKHREEEGENGEMAELWVDARSSEPGAGSRVPWSGPKWWDDG